MRTLRLIEVQIKKMLVAGRLEVAQNGESGCVCVCVFILLCPEGTIVYAAVCLKDTNCARPKGAQSPALHHLCSQVVTVGFGQHDQTLAIPDTGG